MATTNFIDGVTNTPDSRTFGSFIALDPTRTVSFFQDFERFAGAASGATDWLTTLVGSSTAIVDNTANGRVLVTDTTATDSLIAQWRGQNAAATPTPYFFVPGKKAYFQTKFQVSQATLSNAIFGLVSVNTTPFAAVVDGVYFIKVTGSANLILRATKASVSTSLTVAVLADATDITLGYAYNGVDLIEAFVNDVRVGSIPVTNLPIVGLTPTFGLLANTAARTMSVDYIGASFER